MEKVQNHFLNHLHVEMHVIVLVEETPTPWDAIVEVEEDMFRLIGSAGPSGFGKAGVEVPQDQADTYWMVDFVGNDLQSLCELFQDNDIRFTEEVG